MYDKYNIPRKIPNIFGECHRHSGTIMSALERDAIKKKKDAYTVVFFSNTNGVPLIIFEEVAAIPSPISKFYQKRCHVHKRKLSRY